MKVLPHLQTPPGSLSGRMAFPDLPSGGEFKEHLHSFLLRRRERRLDELARCLDAYRASVREYRYLCTVRDHGVAELRSLHDEYLQSLERREFQRRYCLERARWEPGLRLENQALQRLENQTCISHDDVELLRETLATVCHRDEVAEDFTTHFQALQLHRREEKVLRLLELTQEAPAGQRAIADLKRAEVLLHENAEAGRWLARVRAGGDLLPELAQMQHQLAETERRIEQLRLGRERRAEHLRRHEAHVESMRVSAAAHLVEVGRRLRELEGEPFERLVRRDKSGVLAKLRESNRDVELWLARGGADGPS
jgi:hypothetical protein